MIWYTRKRVLVLVAMVLAAIGTASVIDARVQPSTRHAMLHTYTVPQQTSIDWDAVGQALGKSGELMPGNVFRINLPRTDGLTCRAPTCR